MKNFFAPFVARMREIRLIESYKTVTFQISLLEKIKPCNPKIIIKNGIMFITFLKRD
jgi:hypothetical protein